MLPEIQLPPVTVPAVEDLLPERIRTLVDSYMRTRTPASLPTDLVKRHLALSQQEVAAAHARGAPPPVGSSTINVPMLNALILYIGGTAKTVSSVLHPGAQELVNRVAAELDAEGRYLLLNGLTNQLRFPNSHTYYFSCVLLTLFMESRSEALKEQVTRCLLERLIVNRPHPWGLLITFIELIKNRRYNFWSHGFTKCALEIENLFASVSRSCLAGHRVDEEGGMGPGAALGPGPAGGGGPGALR